MVEVQIVGYETPEIGVWEMFLIDISYYIIVILIGCFQCYIQSTKILTTIENPCVVRIGYFIFE